MNLFKIPFYFLAGFLLSCNNDLEPAFQSVAQFGKSTLEIKENSDRSTIEIIFTNPVSQSGVITIEFMNADLTKVSTFPLLVNNKIDLYVSGGQSVAHFDIIPIDNELQEGNTSFEIKLTSLSEHISIGSNQSLKLRIADDEETHSMVYFELSEMEVGENDGNVPLRILYNRPAPQHGYVKVLVESSNKAFATAPATLYSHVRIPIQAGQTESFFDIVPEDNTVIAEDRVVKFKIVEVSAGLLIGVAQSLRVTIKEDD